MIGSSPSRHDSVEMCVCGAIYKTSLIKKYNLQFPSERELISEDLVFNIDYMRVLIINKFLYPNGGSETYIFKLGEALEQHGHEVQYFGMEHEGCCVGNRVNAYTSDMDFHGGSKLSKLTYPIKTIYSKEARVQLRKVLDDFKPNVCHLNNFNYQLTPSIILEIVKWRKETGRDCKIIFTAHDYQLVCPNHMLNNPNTHQNCEKCLGGHFVNCMKGKCIHGSTAKSAIGMMEAEFWKWKGTYKYIDTMICCSEFMKSKMDSNPLFATGVFPRADIWVLICATVGS